jgi:hypothetical protein
MWRKRLKADLILIFSTNTNREIVAYRSFQFIEFLVRGVRKVTTGKHSLAYVYVYVYVTLP